MFRLAASTALLALFTAPLARAEPPDLSGLVPILHEDFRDGLRRYDGRRGIWSTTPVRGKLMTNADQTVFLDHGLLGEEADAKMPPLHVVTDDGLSLRTLRVPEDVLPALRSHMERTGQGKAADRVQYASGEITTSQTWAQTYGYYEIRARVPRGRGRWPAFWLTFAGPGWPPEIDVMEAYGDGLDRSSGRDDTFNTAVFFDARDETFEPVHSVDIENPFAPDREGRTPTVKERGQGLVYNFHHRINAKEALGADIYAEVWTYAALWTPEDIRFYFGPDRAGLKEVFRTPTPPDAHGPMQVIANDQFTARGGWWSPRENAIDRVVTPENDFLIESITLMALPPDRLVDLGSDETPPETGGARIRDTGADDVIAPGAGFHVISLSDGADLLHLTRRHDNTVVEGFDADDRLTLDGWPFEDTADVISRLTQVGEDVWLSGGADPFWPTTVILRDTQVADLAAEQFTVRWSVARDVWATEAARPNRPRKSESGDSMTAQPDGDWMTDGGRAMRLEGGRMADRFTVSHPDTTIEEPASGGIDTLIATVPTRLPGNVEHGILRGTGHRLDGTDGDDRLEADGQDLTLAGGAGDDLYVISPEAERVTIVVDGAGGHGRLRGMGEGHVLHLPGTDADRRMEGSDGGTLITFGSGGSLFVEGLAPAELDPLLGRG